MSEPGLSKSHSAQNRLKLGSNSAQASANVTQGNPSEQATQTIGANRQKSQESLEHWRQKSQESLEQEWRSQEESLKSIESLAGKIIFQILEAAEKNQDPETRKEKKVFPGEKKDLAREKN